MITVDTIKAAQANDIAAVSALLEEMGPRLDLLASRAASSVRRINYQDAREHLRSEANVALWGFIPSFDGDSVDNFRRRAYKHVEAKLKDEAHSLRGVAAGVTKDDIKAFNHAYDKADGDVHLAEKLATIHPYAGSGRMSPERAARTRLVWQGCASLDAPVGGTDTVDRGVTIGDRVSDSNPTPGDLDTVDTTAPARIGVTRVQAALASLEDHIPVPTVAEHRKELFEVLSDIHRGAVTDAHLDLLKLYVSIPTDREGRLFVTNALGILAAYISSAEHTDSDPEDYSVVEEENPEHRATIARSQTVHAILDAMGESQRTVLEYTWGIRGKEAFNRGDDGRDDELASLLGVTPKDVRDRRTKGHRAFAKRWIKAMSRGAKDAEALEAAAKKYLGRAGRK